MNLLDESEGEVRREIGVHGSQWERLHGGYFSDSDVVSCLVKEIRKSIDVLNPDVIVDLAGGTGYVLRELIRSNIDPYIRLVNIDLSRRQLHRTNEPRISTVRKSISNFRRDDICPDAERFLFIMRSAFHYFGKERLAPLLSNLRSQMRKGEMFVHQTASFAFGKDVFCMNMLYKEMGTAKWFPTVREMRRLLRDEGWSIVRVSRAPKSFRRLRFGSGLLGFGFRFIGFQFGLGFLGRFGFSLGLFFLGDDFLRAFLGARVQTLGGDVAVDEFDHRHRRIVAIAEARLHHPRITARPRHVTRADGVEQLAYHGHVVECRQRPALGMQAVGIVLGQCHQLFHHRAKLFRLGQRGGDLLVLNQRARHVGEHRLAMRGCAVELTAGIQMAHVPIPCHPGQAMRQHRAEPGPTVGCRGGSRIAAYRGFRDDTVS